MCQTQVTEKLHFQEITVSIPHLEKVWGILLTALVFCSQIPAQTR